MREPAWFSLVDAAQGTIGVAWTEHGLRAVRLGKDELTCRDEVLRMLPSARRVAPSATPVEIADLLARISAQLGGVPQDFSTLRLDEREVSAFQRAVYRAVQGIPYGASATYGQVAQRIAALASTGGAARAVGGALRKNPWLIVVPCHRVVGAGGALRGFSAQGGVRTQARLLVVERSVAVSAPVPSTWAAPAPAPAYAPAPAGPLWQGTGALPFDAAEAVAALSSAEPVFARMVEAGRTFDLRIQETQSPFEALAEAIVFQQLHGRAAATIFGRLKALSPEGRVPDPQALIGLSDATLRGFGLSGNKVLALRDLAARTLDGTVPDMAGLVALPDSEILERLVRVRGIGRWTVEMLLIFRLGRPDVLPVDDLAIRKGYASAFGRAQLPTSRELARIGERWRPYRTVASLLLWRENDAARQSGSGPFGVP